MTLFGTFKYTKEEKIIVNDPDFMFTCKMCGIPKPNSEFGKTNYESRSVRQYSGHCKHCLRIKQNEYNRTHPEVRVKVRLRTREYNKEYRQREGNKERSRFLMNQRNAKRRVEKPFTVLIYQCKDRAKKVNIDFELSEDFIKELYDRQNGRCFYTNRPLQQTLGYDNSMSVDRKDSMKGYTEDNVCLCCKRVNWIKHEILLDDLVGYCRDIVKVYDSR